MTDSTIKPEDTKTPVVKANEAAKTDAPAAATTLKEEIKTAAK